jgi:hypothetical protein
VELYNTITLTKERNKNGIIFALLLVKADYMERELLITVKRSNYDNEKIDREIAYIKTLFPFLESFETFTVSNQVFDLEQHTVIDTKSRLRHIFNEGIQKNNRFIVSLN